MGCSIHVFTEIKVSGEWFLYSQPKVGRNFLLYSKMSGLVLSASEYCAPIAEPKGLPLDISKVAELRYENFKEDAHTMSWLSSKEVYKLYDFFNPKGLDLDAFFGLVFDRSWSSFNEIGDNPILKEVEDFRFVFYFDNY